LSKKKKRQYERLTGNEHGSQCNRQKRTSMDKAVAEVKRI